MKKNMDNEMEIIMHRDHRDGAPNQFSKQGPTLEAQLHIYWVPVLKTLHNFYTICNPRTYYMGTWASRAT